MISLSKLAFDSNNSKSATYKDLGDYLKSLPGSVLVMPIKYKTPPERPKCPIIDAGFNSSIFDVYSDGEDKDLDADVNLDEAIAYMEEQERKLNLPSVEIMIEDNKLWIYIYKEGKMQSTSVDGEQVKVTVDGDEIIVSKNSKVGRFFVKKALVIPPGYPKTKNDFPSILLNGRGCGRNNLVGDDEKEEEDNIDGLKEGVHAMVLNKAGSSGSRYMTCYQYCLSEGEKISLVDSGATLNVSQGLQKDKDDDYNDDSDTSSLGSMPALQPRTQSYSP